MAVRAREGETRTDLLARSGVPLELQVNHICENIAGSLAGSGFFSMVLRPRYEAQSRSTALRELDCLLTVSCERKIAEFDTEIRFLLEICIECKSLPELTWFAFKVDDRAPHISIASDLAMSALSHSYLRRKNLFDGTYDLRAVRDVERQPKIEEGHLIYKTSSSLYDYVAAAMVEDVRFGQWLDKTPLLKELNVIPDPRLLERPEMSWDLEAIRYAHGIPLDACVNFLKREADLPNPRGNATRPAHFVAYYVPVICTQGSLYEAPWTPGGIGTFSQFAYCQVGHRRKAWPERLDLILCEIEREPSVFFTTVDSLALLIGDVIEKFKGLAEDVIGRDADALMRAPLESALARYMVENGSEVAARRC